MSHIAPLTKSDIAGYTHGYDDLPRFSSYLTQIESIATLGGNNVLEIGKGNGTVSSLLRLRGHQVTTLDFDDRLEPDIVGDVRAIPCSDDSYDIVTCCEVLEHLPFDDFATALREMHRVTRKHAVLSIPYSCLRFESIFRLQDRFVGLRARIPCFFIRPRKSSEHFWEMGRHGYSKRRVRHNITGSGFHIIREISPPPQPLALFLFIGEV